MYRPTFLFMYEVYLRNKRTLPNHILNAFIKSNCASVIATVFQSVRNRILITANRCSVESFALNQRSQSSTNSGRRTALITACYCLTKDDRQPRKEELILDKSLLITSSRNCLSILLPHQFLCFKFLLTSFFSEVMQPKCIIGIADTISITITTTVTTVVAIMISTEITVTITIVANITITITIKVAITAITVTIIITIAFTISITIIITVAITTITIAITINITITITATNTKFVNNHHYNCRYNTIAITNRPTVKNYCYH